VSLREVYPAYYKDYAAKGYYNAPLTVKYRGGRHIIGSGYGDSRAAFYEGGKILIEYLGEE